MRGIDRRTRGAAQRPASLIEQLLGGRLPLRLRAWDGSEAGPAGVGGRCDAVSTIEMGEHVGDAEYPAFARTPHTMLRPRGRALVQQMSRCANAPGGGAFIESSIAPGMHLRPRRVWQLYLVGGRLAFEGRRMGVGQILAVRPTASGESGMHAMPRHWYEHGGPG